MMRVRIPNGISTAAQFRALAEIVEADAYPLRRQAR
jgi:sulfite reductase beta subunit-like hemoprotein